MANKDQPRGLEPFGQLLRIGRYVAGATCRPGDAVHMEDDGKVDPAAASEALLGVALNNAADGEELLVGDHPDQRWIVQADGSDVDAQTDIGLNYNLLATSSSSTYEISRMELDSDTGGTAATLPLRLIGIVQSADNALGAQVDCVVVINNHQLGKNTAGL